MIVSDRTLAELLARRLRGGRVFQLFARKLGPNDVVFVSAMAFAADDNIVRCSGTAEELEDALVQLFAAIDQATAPEEEAGT